MRTSDLFFAIGILAIGILIGFIVTSGFQEFDKRTNQEVIAPEKVPEDSLTKEENWDSIKNLDFELDMEKLGVILIKRSLNDGYEITYVEYENRDPDYFHCSREIHHRLIAQFQELLKKREIEDF